MNRKKRSSRSRTSRFAAMTSTPKLPRNSTRFPKYQKRLHVSSDHLGNELNFVGRLVNPRRENIDFPQASVSSSHETQHCNTNPAKESATGELSTFTSNTKIKFFLVICVALVFVVWTFAALIEYLISGKSLLLNSSIETALLGLFLTVVHCFLPNKQS
jgi:hypothetical protein